MTIKNINNLPADLLKFFGARHAVALCRYDVGHGDVVGCSSSDPNDLMELTDFQILNDKRRELGVNSIQVYVLSATPTALSKCTNKLSELPDVAREIERLNEKYGEVMVVYVTTHFNPEDRPAGGLTVSIGGDCYRDDQQDFKGVLERTALLAKSMLRKSVLMFPDIPVLHGGKKGEWIVIDKGGHAISEVSEACKIFLGELIIKRGIEFINRFKDRKNKAEIGTDISALVKMSPDSASPDTLSGKYWLDLCRAWQEAGLDMRAVTCVPPNGAHSTSEKNGSVKIESALPTGYGVAATAVGLVENLLPEKNVAECKYLIEALGNVSFYTIQSLINRHGIPPQQIIAFDKNRGACDRIEKAFPGVKVVCSSNEEFYRRSEGLENYDVWINNGLGNSTTPNQIDWLLGRGLRIFCGGANNFLRKTDEQISLNAIWNRGGWAWPDEAASGGGWAFAVMDLRARTLGDSVNAQDFINAVTNRVEKSNVNIIKSVMSFPLPTGVQLWERIELEINARIKKTLSRRMSAQEVVAAADIRHWKL